MKLSRPRGGALLLLLLLNLKLALSGNVKIDTLTARISYVSDQERITRQSFTGDLASLGQSTAGEVLAHETDTLIVQVGCVEGSEVYFPEQAFVRLWDEERQREAVYVMERRSRVMRLDVEFRKEMRKKGGFYRADRVYVLEVVVGDRQLKGITWVVTRDLKFVGRAMVTPSPGVFDFDMSVKKHMLPEFEAEIPTQEKRAPPVVVVVFTVLVLLPLVGVLEGWRRLGVLPLVLPSGIGRLVFIGFEICLALQIVALVMFWVGVNILETWKYLSIIMLPTLVFGYYALADVAARDSQAAARMKQPHEKKE